MEVLTEIEKALPICRETLEELRTHVLTHDFPNQAEEIYFFKYIKPTVMGKLLMYLYLAEVELNKPIENTTVQKAYLKETIQTCQNYFKENRSLYRYLKRKRNDRDGEYFVRNPAVLSWEKQALTSHTDPVFSTGYDTITATFIAYNLLVDRIQHELQDIERGGVPAYGPQLIWTASKVDLVELIYALHAAEVCNNGHATIKQIATSIQHVFNITISDYYRTYLEIQDRKNSRTKLLDTLKECLIERIEETERV